MKTIDIEMDANVDVSKILDELRSRRELRSDAALCRELGVSPPTISKLRAGGRLGASVVVRISTRYDMTAKQIYDLGA
jgi:plasmid maintenance system antidote protein VapI